MQRTALQTSFEFPVDFTTLLIIVVKGISAVLCMGSVESTVPNKQLYYTLNVVVTATPFLLWSNQNPKRAMQHQCQASLPNLFTHAAIN
jgi:hypothetical protein